MPYEIVTVNGGEKIVLITPDTTHPEVHTVARAFGYQKYEIKYVAIHDFTELWRQLTFDQGGQKLGMDPETDLSDDENEKEMEKSLDDEIGREGLEAVAPCLGVLRRARVCLAEDRGRFDAIVRDCGGVDALVNNADRKAGHLLVRADGIIQGVDHGVTFALEPKLRTVLWGWRGTRLADRELKVLALLQRALPRLASQLEPHLGADEMAATRARLDELLHGGRFPQPHPDWPAVPWPWY